MFGVVAITLFISTFIFHMSDITHLQFEFVDIICSVSACLLIFGGAGLIMALNTVEKKLRNFQLDLHDFLRNNKKDVGAKTLEFFVATADFRAHRNVPKDFDFVEYGRQCFSDTICQLIDIQWKAWILLNIPVILIWIISAGTDDSEAILSDAGIVAWFVAMCWFNFALQLGFWYYIFRNNQMFQQHLFVSPELIHEASEAVTLTVTLTLILLGTPEQAMEKYLRGKAMEKYNLENQGVPIPEVTFFSCAGRHLSLEYSSIAFCHRHPFARVTTNWTGTRQLLYSVPILPKAADNDDQLCLAFAKEPVPPPSTRTSLNQFIWTWQSQSSRSS